MYLKLQVVGNLGGNAELKVLESGRKVLQFSVAHTEKWKKADGTMAEKTYWIRCNYWFGAENEVRVAEYLVKGTQVLVEGMPEVNGWINNGEALASQELTVHNLRLLGGSGGATKPVANEPGATAPPVPKGDKPEDDLPF